MGKYPVSLLQLPRFLFVVYKLNGAVAFCFFVGRVFEFLTEIIHNGSSLYLVFFYSKNDNQHAGDDVVRLFFQIVTENCNMK